MRPQLRNEIMAGGRTLDVVPFFLFVPGLQIFRETWPERARERERERERERASERERERE